MGNSIVGTQIKFNVRMEAIDGYHLEDVDFEVTVTNHHGTGRHTVKKTEAIRVDADNFIVCIDSGRVGAGRYILQLKALIPDDDFADKLRAEIVSVDTGVTVDEP